jgi:hypothetical protein
VKVIANQWEGKQVRVKYLGETKQQKRKDDEKRCAYFWSNLETIWIQFGGEYKQ